MAETTTDTAPVNSVKAEEAFVAEFSGKLESGAVGTDRGRAKQERVAAAETPEKKKEEAPAKPAAGKTDKSTESPKAGTEATDTSTEERASPGESKADPEDGDEAEDESDTGGDTADDDSEDKDDDDQADDEDEEKADDVEVDADAPEEELAREAREQLDKHGVNMTMDDLPKEARPLVQRKLAQMTAGYTRAMMEARAYRTEEAQFHAERRFIKENPDLFIFEMLQEDPELADRINKRVGEGETETGKEALKVITGKKREEALKAVQSVVQANERVNQRADEIEEYVRTACTKLNLPFDVVVETVVNKLNDKPDDQRNLSNQELDAIIGRHQRTFQQRDGDRKKTVRQQEIIAHMEASRGKK
jgi:hypothetical protein